jgi:hypothetical protein
MPENISEIFEDNELLFRGIKEVFWDFELNRPSSAIFKDSFGISVDRMYNRTEIESVERLKEVKNFYKLCSVFVKDVKTIDAIVFYKPLQDNIYHSEIHNSVDFVQLKGGKPKKLRDRIFKIYE